MKDEGKRRDRWRNGQRKSVCFRVRKTKAAKEVRDGEMRGSEGGNGDEGIRKA